jgi:uncharacterized membrane protein (UPF0182 family)
MVTRIPSPNLGRRRLLVGVVAIAVLVILAFTALSGFFIDLLWFREVHLSEVYWTILRTKAALAIAFGLVFFVALYANLWIVRRITPRYRALTPEQEIIERYRLQFEPYAWWIIPVFAVVIAVFVGLGVTAQWKTFLLWRNSSGVAFGSPEPLFGRDPAFYVFSLPWLEFVQGWVFSALVGILLITGLAHYLWGGIRPNAPGLGDKVTPQVKAHLSVLLGLIILTKAWGYYLGQFDLLSSPRGVVAGASYTDVNAQLPALRILVVIAIVCAVLFLVNIRMRGWALPVIAVGLLALASIAAGAAYPAFVQRFRVAPQELQRERPYLADNIRATRRAFGLDTISSQALPLSGTVTADDVDANGATIQNIRLWRPSVILQNYASLQRIRAYYEFTDVDVDRYIIDGQRRLVMLSAREISQKDIPGGGTWQNRHLVYTHGLGAVASQVNTATAEGQPVFRLSDIPPQGQPPLADNGARVYFGEGVTGDSPYVVVHSGAAELDYQGTAENDQEQVTTRYQGAGGIPLGNWFQRALFAIRYRDVNLMISGLIHGDSRIMINRSLEERVPKAAPFLQYDADPYAAIVDGRLVWIWDAYTSTTGYPYSQPIELGDVASQPVNDTAPALTGDANYLRNSVKVVVDAYDGSMTYYVSDPNDPIVRVWERAFPDLFSPMSDASADLAAHFRYPENLLQVQAAQFTTYHVTDPDVFYGKQDFWQIPDDPAAPTGQIVQMRPYYVLMRLPGEADETFALVVPFTPANRQNMVAWMAAKSDIGDDYGHVTSYEFPSGRNVDGPTQVFARINQNAQFSKERTLLSQAGSDVTFGDFLVLPIENGILYVQPVYVQAKQANSIPELKRVIVVNGTEIGIGTTLEEAIADSIGAAPPPSQGGGNGGTQPPPTGTVDQQVASLLQEAADHFAAADAALREGDLATYQRQIGAARAAIAQAEDLLGGAPSGGTAATGPTGLTGAAGGTGATGAIG